MGRIPPTTRVLPSGQTVLFRSPEAADAAASLAFERHMQITNPYKVVLPGENDRTEEQQREWLQEHLEHDGWLAIMALPQGSKEVVGKLMFRNNQKFVRMRHHGTFGISVHADWRGRGVGTAMIEILLEWAAAHPVIEKVCLGVWANNKGARALYRRLGFVEEGRSAMHFRIGPGEYVDDLDMAVFVKPGLAPEGYRTWPLRPAARDRD
jgi:RimJ/RimL family protein N-acetyltransferase